MNPATHGGDGDGGTCGSPAEHLRRIDGARRAIRGDGGEDRRPAETPYHGAVDDEDGNHRDAKPIEREADRGQPQADNHGEDQDETERRDADIERERLELEHEQRGVEGHGHEHLKEREGVAAQQPSLGVGEARACVVDKPFEDPEQQADRRHGGGQGAPRAGVLEDAIPQRSLHRDEHPDEPRDANHAAPDGDNRRDGARCTGCRADGDDGWNERGEEPRARIDPGGDGEPRDVEPVGAVLEDERAVTATVAAAISAASMTTRSKGLDEVFDALAVFARVREIEETPEKRADWCTFGHGEEGECDERTQIASGMRRT